MSPVIPAPPGFDVGFDDQPLPRFAPPSPSGLFVLGLADRGSVAQARSPGDWAAKFGQRTNYSVAGDAVAVMFGEGGGPVTFSRVTGEDATAATITLNDGESEPAPALKITAPAVGDSYNGAAGGYKAAVAAVSGGGIRVTVTDGDSPVITSPVLADHAALAEWAPTVEPDDGIVEVVGDELPAVTVSPVNLTGGDDDRTNIGVADWTAAAARLDPRFGPGLVLAPGVDDPDVHKVLIDHAAAGTDRLARLDLAPDVTEQAAGDAWAALLADRPEAAWFGALWGSWAYCRPLPGGPLRLVPYSAVDAGIHSRVRRESGAGTASFGEEVAASRTAVRLYREWSTTSNPPGEVQRLYANHVNTAVDRGQAIAAEGYRTLDPDPRREDLHVATIRMILAWEGRRIARKLIGGNNGATWDTVASYNGRIAGLMEQLRAQRAINPIGPSGEDGGYRVVTDDPINTNEMLAVRELHARVVFRPAGSIHWVDLIVGSSTATDEI